MDQKPTLFESVDPTAEAAADARAEADVAAGRLVSHEAVKRWIQSWGTDSPLQRPRIGD
jgi:predicted transcriptional regulator